MYRCGKIFTLLLLVLALTAHLSTAVRLSEEQNMRPRALVLVDDMSVRATHSAFLASLGVLEGSDDAPAVVHLASHAPELSQYGEYSYEVVVLMCPRAALDVESLLDFVDAGRSLMLVGDEVVGEDMRELASELGVEFAADVVRDHFAHDRSDSARAHTLVVSRALEPRVRAQGSVLIGERLATEQPESRSAFVFRGLPHSVTAEQSSLVLPVLRAESTAYVAGPGGLQGGDAVLLSVVQARNNARALICGSLYAFSDAAFGLQVLSAHEEAAAQKSTPQLSGNGELMRALAAWTAKQRGLLRLREFAHHRAGESESAPVYRIRDQLEVEMVLEQWIGNAAAGTGGHWAPFAADDVQLEFAMLDPYVRTTMQQAQAQSGRYVARFEVPDVYGVFTFHVEYRRTGYTAILLDQQVPVRPYRHDEYERFIVTAYPYYAATFSLMCGLFLFSAVFLYTK